MLQAKKTTAGPKKMRQEISWTRKSQEEKVIAKDCRLRKIEEIANLTEVERGSLLDYRNEIQEFYKMEEIMWC